MERALKSRASVADLVTKLHTNIDSIHATLSRLNATSAAHDTELERLSAEREEKIHELRTTHANALKELVAQRQRDEAALVEQRRREKEELELARQREYEELLAKRKREDEERERILAEKEEERLRLVQEEDAKREEEREEMERSLQEKIERELEELEDEMERKVEEGRAALRELDERRRAINAEIDAALNTPTVIPNIQFRSRAKQLSRGMSNGNGGSPLHSPTPDLAPISEVVNGMEEIQNVEAPSSDPISVVNGSRDIHEEEVVLESHGSPPHKPETDPEIPHSEPTVAQEKDAIVTGEETATVLSSVAEQEEVTNHGIDMNVEPQVETGKEICAEDERIDCHEPGNIEDSAVTTTQEVSGLESAPVETANEDISHLEPESNHAVPEVEIKDVSAEEEHLSALDSNVTHSAEITPSDVIVENSIGSKESGSGEMSQEQQATAQEADICDDVEKSDPKEMSPESEKVNEHIEVSSKEISEPEEPISSESAKENTAVLEEQQPESRDIVEGLANTAEEPSNKDVDEAPASVQEHHPEHETIIEEAETKADQHEGSESAEHRSITQDTSETEHNAELQDIHEAESRESSSKLESEAIQPAVVEDEIVPEPRDLDAVLETTQVPTEENVPEPRDLDAELSVSHEPVGAEHKVDLAPEPRDLDAISKLAIQEPESEPEPRDLDARPEPAVLEHDVVPEPRDLDMDTNFAKSEPDVNFEPRDPDAKAQSSPEPSAIPEHETVPEPRDLDTTADLRSPEPEIVPEPRDLDAKIESCPEPTIPENEVVPEPRDLDSKLEASPETDPSTLEESSINEDQEVLPTLAKGAEEESTTQVHAEDHADVESKKLTAQEDSEDTVRAVDEPKIDSSEETLHQSEDKPLDSANGLGDESSDLAHGVPAEVDEHDDKLQELPAEAQETVAAASENVKVKVKEISSDSAEVPSDGPEHINIDAEHGPDGTSIEQPDSLQASSHTDQTEDTDCHQPLEHTISSENTDAIDHHTAPSVEANLETPLEVNGQDGSLSEPKEAVSQSEEPDVSREVNSVMPTHESEPKEAVSHGEEPDLSRELDSVMTTHEVESDPTGVKADIDHEAVRNQMKTDTEELPSDSVDPQDVRESLADKAETRDEKAEHDDMSLERESTEEVTSSETTGLAQQEMPCGCENALSSHEISPYNPTELEHSTPVVNEEPVSHQDVGDSSELRPEQSSSHKDAVKLPETSVERQNVPGVDGPPEKSDESHANGSPPDSIENAGHDDSEQIKDTVKPEEVESSDVAEKVLSQSHELPPASLENIPETEFISTSNDSANAVNTPTNNLLVEESDEKEREETVATSPVMPEHAWMKKTDGPVLHDANENGTSEKTADEDDSNHAVPMVEKILPKEVTEKDVLVDEPLHEIEAPHIEEDGLPTSLDHVEHALEIEQPLITAADSIPDEVNAVDAQVDTSSHGVPLNDQEVLPHSDDISNSSVALKPEAAHSRPETPKPLRRTDSDPEHNGVRLRRLAQGLLSGSDEPITNKASVDVFKYLEPETAENTETEVDDTEIEGSVREGAPLNGSTGPHDHATQNKDLKGQLTPTQHQAIAEATHINRFAESPATVPNTDDIFNDDTDSENSDSEEGDDADEEDDDDDDDDEEEEDEETYDDEDDDDDDEDEDEDEEEEESDEAAPEPVKIPSKVEQSSPPVLHNMPSFAKPKMVDPFSEGPQDQADMSSSHASSGLFASLVDTIRSDVPAVKQMVHNGDIGKSHPNQRDGNDVYHSLSDQATERRVEVPNAFQATERRVEVPNAFQDTDEEQAPFHDTFTHQNILTNLHSRSLTSDTVPSFESYAESDAESNPSEMPPSPVQEDSSQEPKIASSSWPSNEQSADENEELKSEASPLRAEFDPITGVANYPKFVTPKPSQANLRSPRSSRFSQPGDSAKRQYSSRGSISPTPRRFSRGSTGEASQAGDSPPSKRLSTRESGASLGEAYKSSTKPHSPTTQRPIPPASETKPTALDKNTTSPSIPSNSFFQKTRSLFEAQTSPSLPSAVTRPLSGYFNVGRGISASTSPQPQRKGSMASLRNSLPASLAMSAEPALTEEDNFMPRSLDADGKPPSPVFSIPLRRDSSSSQRDRKSSHGSISRVENDLNTFIPSKNIRPRSSNPFLGLGVGNNTERGMRSEGDRQREPLLGGRDGETWGGTRVGDGS